MRRRHGIVLSGALAAMLLAPATVHAQAYAPTFSDQTIHVRQALPDEAAPTIDVFFQALAPYGLWQQDRRFGKVWAPFDVNYRPYHDGTWQLTSYGFTWISSEPFAWATCHYGRWFFKEGRWLWQPNTTWAPAWVSWRETSSGMYGWAPLPPEATMYVAEERWHFVPAQQLFRPDLVKAYATTDLRAAYAASRPLARAVRTSRGDRFASGPDPAALRRYRVSVRTRALPSVATGRFRAESWSSPRFLFEQGGQHARKARK